MDEIADLYQEAILDHNRRPRNFQALPDANRTVEGFNPLCGDHFTLYLRIVDGVVSAASFEGTGCAISKASASMMTESVKGRSIADVERLAADFRSMVTAPTTAAPDTAKLGKLAAFAGVRQFPVRVKCATLAWHALQTALAESGATVTTE